MFSCRTCTQFSTDHLVQMYDLVMEISCSQVVMGINAVKDCVCRNGVFVVDVIVGSCFFVYVESLNCIHKSAFSGCVEYFHYFVDGAYGVDIVYEVGCKIGLNVRCT